MSLAFTSSANHFIINHILLLLCKTEFYLVSWERTSLIICFGWHESYPLFICRSWKGKCVSNF